MLAFFDSLGMPEMILLVIVGLVLYGRNLPEAARNFGQVLAKVRRGFHEFKDQLDRDGQLREMKKALDDAKRDVTGAAAVPRAIADPGRALRDLTNDALVSPINESTTTPPPSPTAANHTPPPPTSPPPPAD